MNNVSFNFFVGKDGKDGQNGNCVHLKKSVEHKCDDVGYIYICM